MLAKVATLPVISHLRGAVKRENLARVSEHMLRLRMTILLGGMSAFLYALLYFFSDHLVKLAEAAIPRKPVFGICLGHQIISLALGAKTFKMKFGHHGVNNPVRDEETGKVLITSQNHGFAVDETTYPPDCRIWFRNVNDRTVEGISHEKLPVLTTQFHPEARPGPRDSGWIFKRFIDTI